MVGLPLGGRTRAVASPAAVAWAPPAPWQEQQRMGWELLELFASPVYYGIGVPRGDGTPVVLVPGFLGSDDYLAVMRGWLRRVGYRPAPSGIDVCIGSIPALGERVQRQVEGVARGARRPVTLIGHSLGGALAGLVARRRPELVEHIITLGSVHGPPPADDRRTSPVGALARQLLWGHATLEREVFAVPLPAGVQLSSIYSREDTVVDWRTSVVEGPCVACYEVPGTHGGLAWNVQVYRRLGLVLAGGAPHGA